MAILVVDMWAGGLVVPVAVAVGLVGVLEALVVLGDMAALEALEALEGQEVDQVDGLDLEVVTTGGPGTGQPEMLPPWPLDRIWHLNCWPSFNNLTMQKTGWLTSLKVDEGPS